MIQSYHMVITYYGVSCFKVQSGDTVLVFDPPSKKSGLKPPRFQADVVFVSHGHDKHNGFENIAGKDKESEPFLINTPGEYEVNGIVIRGVDTFHDTEDGKKLGHNTAYVLSLENINLCHLGDFGEKELRPVTQESFGEVDILFVPVDGGNVLEVENATKVINQIEPKIVIPMHYDSQKKLDIFLKEMGKEKIKPIEKFSFKKKDIADKKGEVVVLKSLIN